MNDGVGCNFFLWAREEALQRATFQSRVEAISPTPQTPQTSSRKIKVEYSLASSGIQTPSTNRRLFTRDDSTTPAVRDTPPTPHGESVGRRAPTRPSSLPSTLYDNVVAILIAENVVINESMERQLFSVIERKVGIYEKLLRCFEDSVYELSSDMAKTSIKNSLGK